MDQEEKGSDELLGAEAIDQEQARVFMEELELGKEEIAVKDVDPEDDEDTEFDDDTPPAAEEHAENEELPAPVQEI
jgi:hypothetical protein